MSADSLTGADAHRFYLELVEQLRTAGVVCGITSGLACVHYGVAETTRDCDLLCHPRSFDVLLSLLTRTSIATTACHYRGNFSPPLHERWHAGGWTSHFIWDTAPDPTTLDVFGHAVRQSSPWHQDLSGPYVGPNVVAEMKRTNRDKDWPAVTGLGIELLRRRDPRGWLHIFDAEVFDELRSELPIPEELAVLRPLLHLAIARDSRLSAALIVERQFWSELDRARTRIYRNAVKPYMRAVALDQRAHSGGLEEQHQGRLACAQQHLDPNPLRTYGAERFIAEARDTVSAFARPDALRWLPDVLAYFVT